MLLDFDFFKIKNHLAPEKGRLLIAEPFLQGDLFGRSTIFLVQYSEDGAVGFILNKPTDHLIKELFVKFPDFDSPVYLGGPVSHDKLFFLHSLGEKIPGSIQINEKLFWGGDFDHLTALLHAGLVQEDQVRFFLGYSGWSPGQLEGEIAENSWIVTQPNVDTILSSDDRFWNESVKRVGGNAAMWQNFPENPELN